jgi:general secretion pathway protein J
MSLRRTGFTLVEVLVASMISVFIALVAAGAIRTMAASNETVDRYINSEAEVQFAANLMESDLDNFYRDDNIENTELIGTVQSLGNGDVTGDLVFYTISRTKARADQPEGDLHEVEYFLAQQQDSTVLMRRLWPNPNKDVNPGGILTVIAEDIQSFEVQYYDGQQWSDEWPEDMESLPQLIAVTLTAKQSGRTIPATASFLISLSQTQGQGQGSDITTLETPGQTGTTAAPVIEGTSG